MGDRTIGVRTTAASLLVALDQEPQRVAQDLAGCAVTTCSDLITDMPDKGLSEGDVEGVSGGHKAP